MGATAEISALASQLEARGYDIAEASNIVGRMVALENMGISAAAIDDVIGWVLLGVATVLATSQFNWWHLLLQIICIAGFFAVCVAATKTSGWIDAHGPRHAAPRRRSRRLPHIAERS